MGGSSGTRKRREILLSGNFILLTRSLDVSKKVLLESGSPYNQEIEQRGKIFTCQVSLRVGVSTVLRLDLG